jgi:hypothetical protein
VSNTCEMDIKVSCKIPVRLKMKINNMGVKLSVHGTQKTITSLQSDN